MQKNPNHSGKPAGSGNPLDDDPELAHISGYNPPELEICPDADSRAGHDAAPPMIRPIRPVQPAEPATEPHAKPMIQHIAPLGPLADRGSSDSEPLQPAAAPTGRKIRAFDQKMGGGNHQDNWNRTPNVTGTGAIHVKSFHCKLSGDSLEFLDMQINEWLDAHPQYEVKQVTTTVGEWIGKTRELALIVNVWV